MMAMPHEDFLRAARHEVQNDKNALLWKSHLDDGEGILDGEPGGQALVIS
jgi:hypothetical protein